MKKTLFASLSIFALVQSSNAALIINVSGSAGSNIINFEATGSISITTPIPQPASASGIGRAPRGTVWDTAFDNNLTGDFIQDSKPATIFALSSNISYQLNSVEFGEIDEFRLNSGANVNEDDFELRMLGSVQNPALVNGDVVSWSGSGTFTLSGGETYDTFFVAGSTGTKDLVDGNQFIVNVAPIPEPSSTILLGLGSLALFIRRKR